LIVQDWYPVCMKMKLDEEGRMYMFASDNNNACV
jgi:hypothetical protein